jgi:hypothetical protein
MLWVLENDLKRLVPHPNDARIWRPAEVSKRGRRAHLHT